MTITCDGLCGAGGEHRAPAEHRSARDSRRMRRGAGLGWGWRSSCSPAGALATVEVTCSCSWRRFSWIAGLLVLGLSNVPARAAEGELDAAIRAYERGEMEQASGLLGAALKTLRAPRERARAWLHLGLSQAALGRREAAKEAFLNARTEDPEVGPDRDRVPPPTLTLWEEACQAVTGELRVEASEPGTRIYLDGRERGSAPLSLSRMPVGRYALRALSRDAHRVYEEAAVSVLPNAVTRVVAKLVPRTGTLRVQARPEGTEVYENGRLLGRASEAPLALPAGRHRLAFRARGHAEVVREVVVEPEKERVVTVHLKRPWYRLLRPWAWIAVSVAAASATGALIAARSAQASLDAIQSGQENRMLDYDRYRHLSAGADKDRRWANALFGVAGAAVVTGIVLFAIGDGPAEPLKRSVRLVPTTHGLVVAGEF